MRSVPVSPTVSERTADGCHVAHTHIRQRAQGTRDDRSMFLDFAGPLERAQGCHRADVKFVAVKLNARIPALDFAQADQLYRVENARLHHQHERRAAGHRSDCRIVRI